MNLINHLDEIVFNLQLKMVGLLLGVLSVFAIIIFVSMRVFEPPNRKLFVGYLTVFSLISMFASPLFIIVSSLYVQTASTCYRIVTTFLLC